MAGTGDVIDALMANFIRAQEIEYDNRNLRGSSRKNVKLKGVGKKEHKYIRGMAQFLLFYKTERVVPKTMQIYKDAYEIFGSYSEVGAARWLVEALLFSKCPLDTVSELVGYSEESLEVFKYLFFDIEQPGLLQRLWLKCCSMIESLSPYDVGRYGYKVEARHLGHESFCRCRIFLTPTEGDTTKLKDLQDSKMNLAKTSATLMVGNVKNYNNPGFSMMLDATGAMYKHIHNEKVFDNKSNGDSDLTIRILNRIQEAYVSKGVDESDRKVSAYSEDLPTRETLPM
jgi:hypothetical protein